MFWVEMEMTMGKALGNREGCLGSPWQQAVAGSLLSQLWAVLFPCPVTFTARGMRLYFDLFLHHFMRLDS